MFNSAFLAPIPILAFNPACVSKHARRPHLYRTPVTMKTNIASDSQIRTVDIFQDKSIPIENSSSPHLPVLILPGYGADASEYETMASLLREQLPPDCPVSVVPIRALTWVKTIGGLPVTPVLEILDECVKKTMEESGEDGVNIVAHSAAGWISRIYLGDKPYPPQSDANGKIWSGAKYVNTLLCLGTPQMSSEPVTLANMNFVNEEYPGAFHNDVKYINISGDGVSVEASKEGWRWRFWEKNWLPRTSYALTDGDKSGEAKSGDGIVPLSVAFLDNADANIRLVGVVHSPSSEDQLWYGHKLVVKYWSQFLK